MFALESPHRGDSIEFTIYTNFNIKKKFHPELFLICSHWIFFSNGLKNEFEIAAVNEPSVFEPLSFTVFCICSTCPTIYVVTICNISLICRNWNVRVHCTEF